MRNADHVNIQCPQDVRGKLAAFSQPPSLPFRHWDCEQRIVRRTNRKPVVHELPQMAGCIPTPTRCQGGYFPLAAASLASTSSFPMPRRDAMAANASGLGFALPDSQA